MRNTDFLFFNHLTHLTAVGLDKQAAAAVDSLHAAALQVVNRLATGYSLSASSGGYACEESHGDTVGGLGIGRARQLLVFGRYRIAIAGVVLLVELAEVAGIGRIACCLNRLVFRPDFIAGVQVLGNNEIVQQEPSAIV